MEKRDFMTAYVSEMHAFVCRTRRQKKGVQQAVRRGDSPLETHSGVRGGLGYPTDTKATLVFRKYARWRWVVQAGWTSGNYRGRTKYEDRVGVAKMKSDPNLEVGMSYSEAAASPANPHGTGTAMNQESKNIECPNCGFAIDVNDILYHQLDAELKKKYNDDLAREKKRFDEQQDSLKAERAALEAEKSKLDEQIEERVKAGLSGQSKKLEEKIKKRLEDEQSERVSDLQKELAEKSEKVKELNKTKTEIEQLKREKDELRGVIELEAQKKLNETLSIEREKIQKQEEEKANLAGSEKDILIRQLTEQLKEASKRAEQGSMQVQGEAQELVIEEWLASDVSVGHD